MDQHLLSYYLGIFIVFASHLYMLVYPDHPLSTTSQHVYLNLFAALCIAYYFMSKEGFIKF
jgi:hypothetical protein